MTFWILCALGVAGVALAFWIDQRNAREGCGCCIDGWYTNPCSRHYQEANDLYR